MLTSKHYSLAALQRVLRPARCSADGDHGWRSAAKDFKRYAADKSLSRADRAYAAALQARAEDVRADRERPKKVTE